jgi:hypothetical protein
MISRYLLVMLLVSLATAHPLDMMVGDADRYVDLGRWTRFGLMWLIAFLSIFVLIAVVNNLESAYFQFRVHGVRWIRNIPAMWRLKELTPYSIFKNSSKIRRKPYTRVTLYYLIVGGVLVACAGSSWYSDILRLLAGLYFSFAATQLVIHGRTPAILVLGASDHQASALAYKLNVMFVTVGVANLLSTESSAAVSAGFQRLSGSSLRTSNDFEGRWPEVVTELAGLVPWIVFDARTLTPSAEKELQMIREIDTVASVWLVVPSTFSQAPVVSGLPKFRSFRSETSLISDLMRRMGFSGCFIESRYRVYRCHRRYAKQLKRSSH